MADKLSYELAMTQISALMGWIAQAGRNPDFLSERDMLEVRTGPRQEIRLQTRNSDIRSHWDPMDGDGQLRARDALMDTLKRMRVREGMSVMIGPPMWETG
jgi:hypothetical protein